MTPIRAAICLAVVLVALIAVQGCGGGGSSSSVVVFKFAPASLMMEDQRISQATCEPLDQSKREYDCHFVTNKYSSTFGDAKIVVAESGKTYSVEHCEARSRNQYSEETEGDPCAALG
jgi:hypothetical protein